MTSGSRPSEAVHDFLVVTRAGRASLHEEWLRSPERRGFDLFVSAYDPSVRPPKGPGLSGEYRPGSKIAGYGALLHEREALLRRYAYVMLVDDDIEADAETLTQAFRIAAAHRLKICQPSLTHDSHFTYAGLLQNRAFALRYVNFVEMMCPIFRIDVLLRARALFRLGYESGIDLIWCNLDDPAPRDYAVIDAVAVRHTRPVGSGKAANGFVDGRTYDDDIAAVLDRFDIPWLSCVPYAGEWRHGGVVTNRWRLGLATIGLLAAVPRRADMLNRLRLVAVHWSHLLRRPARNLSISLPVGAAAASRR